MQNRHPFLVRLVFSFLWFGILPSAGNLEAQFTFTLSTTADNARATPAFDCAGNGRHSFPRQESGLPEVGGMIGGQCVFKEPIPLHRALSLLSLAPDGLEQERVLFNVDTVIGTISGPGLLEQKTIFFDGQAMSYGVSHAAPPITDQAWVYLGASRERWMESVQNDLPDLRVADLVLPGAHDAGMYVLNVHNVSEAIGRLCKQGGVIDAICAAGGSLGAQLIANLALNQKDTAYDQLRIGTRFFDFRPGLGPDGVAYHIHNFVPGVAFDEFLGDVDRFLTQSTREVVFLQISSIEIDRSAFTPLTRDQVKQALMRTISSAVGFTLVDDITAFNNRKLADVAQGGGARVIAVFGHDHVNKSYEAEAYTRSLTDPQYIIGALDSALAKCSSSTYQYNNLHLQDTGQVALEHYKDEIAIHLASWVYDLLISDKGSLLQATKPFFDRGTYAWLTETSTLAGLTECGAPVMLLNDFVDPGLAARGEALTRHRYSRGGYSTTGYTHTKTAPPRADALSSSEILALTYNVNWQRMTTGKHGICEVTGKAPNGQPTTLCAKNMGQAMDRYPSDYGAGNYDFVALQEATNWQVLQSWAPNTLGKMTPVVSKKASAEMVTFYDHNKYGLIRLLDADLSHGRPVQILLLEDAAENEVVFINLHNCHQGCDLTFIDDRLAEIVDGEDPSERQEILARIRRSRIFMAGDFNEADYQNTDIWNPPFLDLGIGRYVGLTGAPITCCSDSLPWECSPSGSYGCRPGDYLFDSHCPAAPEIPDRYDPSMEQSDHKPVIAVLRGFSNPECPIPPPTS